MLAQLALASGMVAVVVIMHLVGLALLVRALRTLYRILRRIQVTPLLLLIGASLGLSGHRTAPSGRKRGVGFPVAETSAQV